MMLDYENIETYRLLIRVCDKFGVEPDSSVASERYFRKLLASYEGNIDSVSITVWLEREIAANFVSIGSRPKWIQSAEWPFGEDKPMIFVGQLDINIRENPDSSKFFHDDTSFYVFVGARRPAVVIMQQY